MRAGARRPRIAAWRAMIVILINEWEKILEERSNDRGEAQRRLVRVDPESSLERMRR
jgi:hypothetical protein